MFTRSLVVIGVLLVGITTGYGHQSVVVVPLGDDAKSIQNVITVAKSGGDFTRLSNALNSISGASATNPYLVVVGPGIFDEFDPGPLTVPSYVHVTGSGQETTVIRSNEAGSDNLNRTAAAIELSVYSKLSNLTIKLFTFDDNDHVIGVYIPPRAFDTQTPAKLQNVEIDTASFPLLTNIGVYDDGGDTEIIGSRLFVQKTGALGTTLYGVFITGSDTVIDGTDITARSTTDGTTYGVYQVLQNNNTTVIRNSTIFTGSTVRGTHTGVRNLDFNDNLFITNSRVEGVQNSVRGDMVISHSTLVGAVHTDGTQKCFGVIDGGDEDTATELANDCS